MLGSAGLRAAAVLSCWSLELAEGVLSQLREGGGTGRGHGCAAAAHPLTAAAHDTPRWPSAAPPYPQVGDGTTTVVLLAAEFLKACKGFVEEGVHPQGIIRSFRQAAQLAVAHVRALATDIGGKDLEERKALLQKCAQTSLNSKLVRACGAGLGVAACAAGLGGGGRCGRPALSPALSRPRPVAAPPTAAAPPTPPPPCQVSGERDFFAQMVVDAVTTLDPESVDLRMLGIKKVQGGGLRDSFLVDGVAFKKTFSYAGFEMQPKSYDVRRWGRWGRCACLAPRPAPPLPSIAHTHTPTPTHLCTALPPPNPHRPQSPSILLLNIELELKSEKENAEIRLDDPAQYQSIVDAGAPPGPCARRCSAEARASSRAPQADNRRAAAAAAMCSQGRGAVLALPPPHQPPIAPLALPNPPQS